METGSRLNHYEIVGALGEGGMGQVYRAEDTRLRRQVALKVLPPEVAGDPERLARLEREAQLLARLEHPNVAAVYGLEEDGPTRFLVMQLIEGQPLSERIADGLTVEAVIPLALQIAEGLEAAHERGIVHRDLKPANIMVTPEGSVRILDFGLAKGLGSDADPASRSPELTASPTMLAPTQAGVILGTAAYMSPEQARGLAVDKRTDIWAFGCVLYEMLAERSAFGGETVTDVLAAIVHRDPDTDRLPAGTPRRLRTLLGRCFEKDPLRRLRDIGEARIALERVLRDPGESVEDVSGSGARPALPRWVLPALLATAVVAILATGTLTGWGPTGSAPVRNVQPQRFALDADSINVFDRFPRLSPDGRRVVFHDGAGLAVRDLGEVDPRRIPGTEMATFPFWSPDSEQLGFVSEGRLWRVSAAGGDHVPVSSVGELEGASWRQDGIIVFADDQGLWSVPARGGDARRLLDIADVPAGEPLNDLHVPSVLPDGRSVVFRIHGSTTMTGGIGLWDGERARVLVEPGSPEERLDDPIYSPSGHLLYTRIGGPNPGVWAHPFELDSLELVGEPLLVYPGRSLGGIGSNGSLLLVDGLLNLALELVWVGRDGTLGETFGPRIELSPPYPSVAPDGSRVAVQMSERGSSGTDIWVLEANGGRLRVTAEEGAETEPVWHPTDGRIFYTRELEDGRYEIWARDPSSADPPVLIIEGRGPALTPDGRQLVYAREAAAGSELDLWLLDLDGSGEPRGLPSTPATDYVPAVSPDGRWLAFMSNVSGSAEVYVQAFPAGGNRRIVSTGGGWAPRWSADGEWLYYLEPGTGIMAVAVETPEFGVPETLLTAAMPGLSALLFGAGVGYDIGPDGQRFLASSQAGGEDATRMLLIQNWEADLNEGR